MQDQQEVRSNYNELISNLTNIEDHQSVDYARGCLHLAHFLNGLTVSDAKNLLDGQDYRLLADGYASEALEVLEDIPDQEYLVAFAWAAKGLAHWYADGGPALSRSFYQQAVDCLMQIPCNSRSEVQTRCLGEYLMNLALAEQDQSQHEKALSDLERARQYLCPVKDAHHHYTVSMIFANLYHDLGRLIEMRQTLDKVESDSHHSTDRRIRWLSSRMLLCVSHGEYQAMHSVFGELYCCFEEIRPIDSQLAAAMARAARILSNIGEPLLARDCMRMLQDIPAQNAPHSLRFGQPYAQATLDYNDGLYSEAIHLLNEIRLRPVLHDEEFNRSAFAILESRCRVALDDRAGALEALVSTGVVPVADVADTSDWEYALHRVPVLLEMASILLDVSSDNRRQGELKQARQLLSVLFQNMSHFRQTEYCVGCYQLLGQYLSIASCNAEATAWLKMALRRTLERKIFLHADMPATNIDLQRHLQSVDLLSGLLLRQARFLEEEKISTVKSHLTACLRGAEVHNAGLAPYIVLTGFETQLTSKFEEIADHPDPCAGLSVVVEQVLSPAPVAGPAHAEKTVSISDPEVALTISADESGVHTRLVDGAHDKQLHVAVDLSVVLATICQLRQSLLVSWGDWRTPARDLYRWLLADALKDINEERRLCISTCDVLSWIPFAALVSGDRCLVDLHEVTMVGAIARRRKCSGAYRNIALQSGIAGAANQQSQGAAAEIQAVALLYGKETCELIISTPDKLFANEEYSIIHLAGHFEIDGENTTKTVFECPGGESVGLPALISSNSLHCDLVFLSACNTAVRAFANDTGPYPARSSFAELLQQQGASEVIGTLWPVPDDHTELFVTEFYRGLKSGEDACTALTQAQRHFNSIDKGANTHWTAYRHFS